MKVYDQTPRERKGRDEGTMNGLWMRRERYFRYSGTILPGYNVYEAELRCIRKLTSNLFSFRLRIHPLRTHDTVHTTPVYSALTIFRQSVFVARQGTPVF